MKQFNGVKADYMSLMSSIFLMASRVQLTKPVKQSRQLKRLRLTAGHSQPLLSPDPGQNSPVSRSAALAANHGWDKY